MRATTSAPWARSAPNIQVMMVVVVREPGLQGFTAL